MTTIVYKKINKISVRQFCWFKRIFFWKTSIVLWFCSGKPINGYKNVMILFSCLALRPLSCIKSYKSASQYTAKKELVLTKSHKLGVSRAKNWLLCENNIFYMRTVVDFMAAVTAFFYFRLFFFSAPLHIVSHWSG